MFRKVTPSCRTLLLAAASTAALSLSASPAAAFTCDDNYAGGNGSDWNTAGSWAGGAPTSSTNACIGAGIGTITLSGTGNTDDFSLGSGDTLDLPGTLNVYGTTLDNFGIINIQDGNLTVQNTSLTLDGGGTINMSSNSFLNQGSSGLTLDNVNNAIAGTGQLGQNGLALINETNGTVNSNAGGTLTMNGGGAITNTGLLEATNGTLQINNVVNNAGGNITADGGTVNLSGAVTGGMLNTVGTGVMNSNTSLTNVTLSSGSTLNDSGTTDLVTMFTNNGTVTLPDTNLTVDSTTLTLNGGGIIKMSSNAFFNEAASNETLDNVDNTIEGAGQVGQNGLALINETNGTVNSNAGGTLTMNGGGAITNTGLLEATNGTLQINNVVNNAGGNITADGGTVNLSGAVTGGMLNTVGTGVMNSNTSLTNVTLSSGSTLNDSGTTDLVTMFTNNGTVTLPDTNLTVDSTTLTLNGGGIIKMSSNAFFNEAASNETLDNVDNTIEGTGQVGQNGLALDNETSGLVLANVNAGTLTLNGGGAVSNAGILEANNHGTLQISNSVTQTGGGYIWANGGTVNISATINGGTLYNEAGGTLQTIGTATLNGITLNDGTYTDAGNTNLVGTITNESVFAVPNGNLIVAGGDVTLKGGGIVNMSADAFFREASGGLTLHNVDNTIEGTGQVGENGLALDNQVDGLVLANMSAGTLTLNGGGTVANAGELEARGGGILQISNTVNQTGNGFIEANGGTVDISATINGGTLDSESGGIMQTNGTATLNGITNFANYIDAGTTFLEGTITNESVFRVPDGNLTIAGGDVTLTGSGFVVMSSGAFFNEATSGLTLHNVNNLIEGTGQLGENGMALDNEANGEVLANVNGGTLTLNGGGTITNTGLLEAFGGGTLQISNTVNNAGGDILASDSGTVDISATINGGTLDDNHAHGGILQTNGTATLNGVTLASGDYIDAGTTNLEGTITNEGTFLVPNGNLTVEGGNVTLTGGGIVQMSSDAIFNEASSGLTLINVDNTIEGTGELGRNGLSLDNQAGGTVLANVNGGTLNINGGGSVTNDGTFQVNGGSELLVNSGTLTNYDAVGRTLSGGTYNAFAGGGTATLQINELGVGGGEILNNNANIYLSGAHSNFYDASGLNALSNLDNNESGGTFELDSGRTFTTQTLYDNAGQTIVGNGGNLVIGNLTRATYDQTGNSASNTQVDGTGTITAYDFDVHSGTLEGTGAVSVVDDLFNYGTVKPGDLGSVGTLEVDGNYMQGHGGTLEMDLAATNNYSRLFNDATTTTLYDGVGSSTLAIELLHSFHLASGESFELIRTTGSFFDIFTDITLDGHACAGPDNHLTCGGLAGLYLSAEFCNSVGANCSLNPTGLDYFWVETFPQRQQGVPEPGSLLLLGSGIGAAGAMWRRRKRAARA